MPKDPNDYAQARFVAGEIEDDLMGRQRPGESIGLAAKRDLARYYALLRLELPDLSPAQWNLLRDILNGTLIDVPTAQMLWAKVEDAEEAYFEKWDVERAELVETLAALPLAARLAVCDAVERWRLAQ